MRLISLKPYYFRAFCDNPEMRFADDLTIFYGNNGTGKSSLAEAIEWLLYGSTSRRRKGDIYSKTEYLGTYVNKRWRGGDLPYVEARLQMTDGAVHVLRRTMQIADPMKLDDTNAVLTYDGTKLDDLASIGLVFGEPQCPVVLQHGIQNFIHTRPIDRYRAISGVLGLGDLTSFKDVLERAKNQFRTTLPANVIQARRVVQGLAGTLTALGLKTHAKRWREENIDVESDYAVITERAMQATGSQASSQPDLLQDVRERQSQEMARIFDASPFRPNPNWSTLTSEIDSLVPQARTAYQQAIEIASELLKAATARFSAAQITFWRTGLELIGSTNPDICPFCEQPTLTPERIAERRRRLEDDLQFDDLRRSFSEGCDRSLDVLAKVSEALQLLLIGRLDAPDKAILSKAFERGAERLEEFDEQNRGITDVLQDQYNAVTTAKRVLERAKASVTDPVQVVGAAEGMAQAINLLPQTAGPLVDAFRAYSAVFASFEPVLKRELADEKTVVQYTHLIELLSNRPSVELVATAHRLEADLLECQRLTDSYILEKQRDALAARQGDIISWYGLLSPNADVCFSGFVPGKNEVGLKARAFGDEINAAACLSQSQLNCLGLGVYISTVMDSSSPFRFIVFDDPVQSMDDEHHESFLLKVIPEILDAHHLQVIVLTHLKDTAERMRNLHLERDPLYYRCDKLKQTGPQVTEYFPITHELKRIRDLAIGNDDERVLAVDRIRVLCELVIRHAYVGATRREVPADYRRATGRQMLPLLRSIPGVTAKLKAQVGDTIEWSDPSHHTDPGWQPPASEQIKPHIDRLNTIVTQLGLPKD